ncbi:MAG TPA: alpha/beta hydrolase [Candidatus Limnocylindrales bacterium]|nr:alpha/beta hydrolase [Candidatus Limnocylindrales bacterium]
MLWQPAELQTNGIRIHYYRLGEGPPLLLLHGIGANARTWGRAAGALAARHLVIAPDARGHGQSEKPERGYRDADYIADVAGLIMELQLAPVDAIGHSVGGRIVAELAADRPELFHRIVLEEAVGGAPAARPAAEEAQMRAGARVWLERLRATPREAVLAQTRQRQPGWTDAECEAFVDSQREFSMAIYGDQSLGYFWDWRPAVARIRHPMLVLLGDRSAPRFPPSSADETTRDEIAGLLPAARVVQIKGAGHLLHLDQPHEFVEAVEPFLS